MVIIYFQVCYPALAVGVVRVFFHRYHADGVGFGHQIAGLHGQPQFQMLGPVAVAAPGVHVLAAVLLFVVPVFVQYLDFVHAGVSQQQVYVCHTFLQVWQLVQHTVPVELRKAHQENDRAVIEAYGFVVKDTTESSCVARLFELYQELAK